MRICLYTETALPKVGGQEMVVDALARQFLDLGHDVTVLAPLPRLPLRPRDETLPYRVERHPRFLSTRYLVSWYRWWLLRLFRRRPFDVLHCHGLYPSGYLGALCKQHLGVPMTITSHGGDVQRDNVRLARPVLRERHVHALRHADRLVAISRFTAEGFAWLCPQHPPIETIPNGVDLTKFATPLPLPASLQGKVRSKSYFLFLGRLKKRKAVDVLLDAMARLDPAKSLPLVIAGAGEENAALIAQTQQLGMQHKVHFLGNTDFPDKAALLQHAFCTIVPSRMWESFGLVVLESYASGTPVIVSALPGLEDLVRENETGLVVPPEAPIELAGAMEFLLDHRPSVPWMGEQARKTAQGFSWRSIALRHVELYQRLIEQQQRKSA